MDQDSELFRLAVQLKQKLDERQQKIVLAESCTAGLVAATLGQVSGISNWLCGSAVTYRETTKTAWLNVGESIIEEHNVVSQQVAEGMATGVLNMTPEAQISAAITGHLGPTDDTDRDGLIHTAIARRFSSGLEIDIEPVAHESHRLSSYTENERVQRQKSAALHVLQLLLKTI